MGKGNRRIVPIVEGRSEVASVPILLRDLLSKAGESDVEIAKPLLVHRYKVVKENELERGVLLALSREDAGAILVLLDADADCPGLLGPALLRRIRKVTDVPSAVVLAKKEFEAWLLGSLESYRGKQGISETAKPPINPEQISNAKEKFSKFMKGRKYLSVLHQPMFAASLNFTAARSRCPSFDKFCRDVESLVDRMKMDGRV